MKHSNLKGGTLELGFFKNSLPTVRPSVSSNVFNRERHNLKEVVREHRQSHFKMGYMDPRPITASLGAPPKAEEVKEVRANPYLGYVSKMK